MKILLVIKVNRGFVMKESLVGTESFSEVENEDRDQSIDRESINFKDDELLRSEIQKKQRQDEEKLKLVRRELYSMKDGDTFDSKGDVEESGVKTNSDQEIEVIDGVEYIVRYVPRSDIYPAYGYAYENIVEVRSDLPQRVKRFVKAHELYHCRDKSSWGGWIAREARANIVPGLKDPVGFASTAWSSLTDIDRLKFYFQRLKKGE